MKLFDGSPIGCFFDLLTCYLMFSFLLPFMTLSGLRQLVVSKLLTEQKKKNPAEVFFTNPAEVVVEFDAGMQLEELDIGGSGSDQLQVE